MKPQPQEGEESKVTFRFDVEESVSLRADMLLLKIKQRGIRMKKHDFCGFLVKYAVDAIEKRGISQVFSLKGAADEGTTGE